MDVEKNLEAFRAQCEMISRNAPLSKLLHDVCPRRSYYRAHRIFEKKPQYWQIRQNQRRALEMVGLIQECANLRWEVFELHPRTRIPIQFRHGALAVMMSAVAHETGKRGWFLVEVASVPDESMEKVMAHKLERAHPALYGHCILGLGFSKMDSCAVFLSSDSGEAYVEMILPNPDLFNRLVALSEAIINSKIPDAHTIPECKTCDYEELCFNPEVIPEPSCYTCDYKEGIGDEVGKIQCLRWQKPINATDALEGCLAHLYNPNLFKFGQWKTKVALENGEFGHIYEVGNKSILNCSARASKETKLLEHGLLFTSRELYIGGVAAITHPQVQAIKEQFAGSKIIDFTRTGNQE